LQHADNVGKSLLDATYERGPLHNAEVELYRRATSSVNTFFPLSLLVHHFSSGSDADNHALHNRGFGKIMSMGAQLWARLVCLLTNTPWSMIQLSDQRNSAETLARLRAEFMAKLECDLDPECGRIVQAEAKVHPEALIEATESIIAAAAQHCQGTNMGMERLLSLVRSATPVCKGRKPRAARVVGRGMLTQLMRRQLDCGLPDNRGHQVRELIKDGVQVNCNRHRAKGTVRWHLRYANSKVAEHKAIPY